MTVVLPLETGIDPDSGLGGLLERINEAIASVERGEALRHVVVM